MMVKSLSDEVGKAIKEIFDSSDFWEQSKEIVKVISEAVESEYFSIAEAVHNIISSSHLSELAKDFSEFLKELSKIFDEDEKEELKNKIEFLYVISKKHPTKRNNKIRQKKSVYRLKVKDKIYLREQDAKLKVNFVVKYKIFVE